MGHSEWTGRYWLAKCVKAPLHKRRSLSQSVENEMRFENRSSAQPCCQPRRHRLALLTFVGLLAPVYFVPLAVSLVLSGPRLLTYSTTVAGVVVLMTYVIMPMLTRVAANWLYEPTSKKTEHLRWRL